MCCEDFDLCAGCYARDAKTRSAHEAHHVFLRLPPGADAVVSARACKLPADFFQGAGARTPRISLCVVCCGVLCCAVLCCVVVSCRVVSCAVLCCAVLWCRVVPCRVAWCRVVSCVCHPACALGCGACLFAWASRYCTDRAVVVMFSRLLVLSACLSACLPCQATAACRCLAPVARTWPVRRYRFVAPAPLTWTAFKRLVRLVLFLRAALSVGCFCAPRVAWLSS